MAMTPNEHDKNQIVAIIEQYRRGSAAMDVAALETIWDQDYDNIVYVAQEAAHHYEVGRRCSSTTSRSPAFLCLV